MIGDQASRAELRAHLSVEMFKRQRRKVEDSGFKKILLNPLSSALWGEEACDEGLPVAGSK